MALQYTNIPEQDFGRGIDARSAENQIGEGFVRDLLNADVIEKRVRKRTGYQSYAGNVPVRTTRMDYDTNVDPSKRMICFTLDSIVSLNTTISLESVRSSPLVIYGRSSTFTTGQGPITTSGDVALYYDRFTIPIRKELLAPSGTLTIAGTEHGLGTSQFFCNVVESDSTLNNSYSDILTDAVRINTSTYDINIDYTVYQNTNAIVYYLNKPTTAGDVYVQTWNHPGGTDTLPIPTTTHNLTNFNIVSKIYEDTLSEWTEIEEDDFTLDNAGNVSITITAAVPTVYQIVLSAAPTTNVKEGQIGPLLAQQNVTIENLSHPWVFYNIYVKKPSSSDYEKVEANSVSYDNLNNSITFNFDTYAAESYKIFYEYGDIRSNVLCVYDSSVTVDGTDVSPQVTIWGLDHSEIYTDKTNREGWVTHIDTYRRSGEQRVVCGLGGNLFIARDFGEIWNSDTAETYDSEYLYPTLYPSLYSRTSAELRIGPVFYDSTDSPARTRGYIRTTGGGTSKVLITSVVYDSSNNGWTKYTLSVPNMDIQGTLSTIISTTVGLEDWLTVSNMSYKRHEGTFKIKQVTPGTNQLEIWVENNSNSVDYNDLNTGGYAGIFTDQITWSANCSYIPNDTLLLSGQELTAVYSSSQTTTVCGPFNDLVDLANGVLITAKRTSSVIPMRLGLPSLTDSVTNLVRGDMLSYTGLNRQLRVLSINAGPDYTITSIVGDGQIATVTLAGGGTTEYLSGDQKVILISAGPYSGLQTVTDILSSTVFTISSELTEAVGTAILSGKTIEVDENLEWQDTAGDQTKFQVIRRWIPVEAPDDSWALTPFTHVRYFESDEYSDQSFIRSTTVSDNLYLTNGKDEVMKFDGQNIYRAGLPAWQPALFITQDTSATAKIVLPKPRSIPYTVSSGLANYLTRGELPINAADIQVIPVGTKVIVDGYTAAPYIVRNYVDKSSGGGNHVIQFDRGLDTSIVSSGTIYEIPGTYKYYFRLNAVDANNNIIASAMTSSDDMSIEMTANAAINIKLVGLPTFDNYDYDRIEVQIYRTKLLTGTVAPVFYLVDTIALNFNNTNGYILYTDTASDSDLNQLDVTSAIAGAELGINWSDPPRAKYITTTSNRLILGNVKDYPELDMQIFAPPTLNNSQITGNTVFFKRDASDAGLTSNVVDRIKFQWRNGADRITVTGLTGVLNTSFTVTVNNTAAIGDWVYLTYDTVATSGRPLKYSGWWQIASRTPTSITINFNQADSGAVATYPNRAVFSSIAGTVPVLLNTDGNLGQLNGDTFDIFDATRRLALAINCVMRQVDVTISGMSAFRPWLSARSGNDLASGGRIVVRSTEAVDVFPSVQWTFSNYNVFINSIQVASNESVQAAQKIFPSRVLISYPNYPEIFDNPTSILDIDSLSAIDINPADGQEITGIIPFFGETAFTAAQQESALVVFKTNSIYLVNINQKASGGSLVVQRLETQGLGCTAPYSISVTRNGIMFANNSGIYALGKDQNIRYIGKFMERNWVGRVDSNALELAQGHHYAVGRMYKLSIPLTNNANATTGYQEPTEVYAYNHTQEDEQGALGAWSRYDNHTAIGWANLASDAFWASTGGNVYILRATGTVSDFRDSNQPIVFRLDTRPNSYGNSGIRKVLDKIVASYRTATGTSSNLLYYSTDLEQEYSLTTPFNVKGTAALTGLSDIIGKDIVTLRHSLDRRKGVYFSIRIENNNLDENVEVAGLDYRVGALDSKGILSAEKT